MNNKPTILITGAGGRVGTLLRPLLRQNYLLRLIDINAIDDPQEGEQVVHGDLADPEIASLVMRGAAGVVHLAAAVSPNIDFAGTYRPNYVAILNLLEAARRHDVKRFVFASSHHAVGMLSSADPVPSEALPAPDGFYGLSKAFGEAACAMYSHRFGIRTLIVRIGNVDPQIVDGRRERLWTSGRDLAQIIEIGLAEGNYQHEVVHGLSRCPRPLLSNESALRLGFEPRDCATENHASTFVPLDSLTAKDGIDFIGGFFAVTELPDPTGTL